MRTRQMSFLDFIGASGTQLVIPVYQRVYAWTARQCDTLWADAMRAGAAESSHFIGTVLYGNEPCEETFAECGIETRLAVIDGQQRTVTVLLLLAALRDYLRESDAELAEELDVRYLHVAGAQIAGTSGAARQMPAKIILSRVDRATMEAVVEGMPMPEGDDLSANVQDNYGHFRSRMAEDSFSPEDAETLLAGLRRLLIVAAELEPEDRAQLIFESLNAKGMALTTADLIRNLLLVNLPLEEQDRLYADYWAPVERLYSGDTEGLSLNAALKGWLAVTAPKLRASATDDVYGAFRTFLQDQNTRSMEELLMGLKGFCENFAVRTQAAAKRPKQDDWDTSRTGKLISEKKLFGC